METKRRIEEVLNRFAAQEWTPEERAVELLERSATWKREGCVDALDDRRSGDGAHGG